MRCVIELRMMSGGLVSAVGVRFGEIKDGDEEEADANEFLRPSHRDNEISKRHPSVLDERERINTDRMSVDKAVDGKASEGIEKQAGDDGPNKNRYAEPNESDIARLEIFASQKDGNGEI